MTWAEHHVVSELLEICEKGLRDRDARTLEILAYAKGMLRKFEDRQERCKRIREERWRREP